MSDETSVAKAAKSELFRFVIQGCILLITAVGFPMAGYMADRMVKTLDKISEKQDLTKEEIGRLNQTIVGIQGEARILNSRIDETNRSFTSRIDALSAWTRKNSDEIDKVKDWFYKPK